MLNQDSLAQLKGLKTQMEAEKERAEAVVKGTQARYGFAVLDDGREIFIPPDEMLKAFPEDRVRVCIRPTRDNKTIADIEKLIDCPLGDFTGRCVRKGKAVFVEPDLPQLSRWLFIPPHARNGVKEGDYVRCAILRHPIRDGKPQAKILSVIGDEDTPGIENLYSMAKYRLSADWGATSRKELEQQLAQCRPLETERRRDLTDLEFISIDAAKTQDIDDALYAQIADDGWTLFVGIADPTSYIPTDSELHRDVAARGTSVYFHGDVLPMLPEELSQDTCALSEGVDRPALVCKLSVHDNGEVGDFEFMEATVRSRAKLSYYAVDKYLSGQDDELMSHASPLEALYQVYRALRAHREEHHLVMEERQEYRWIMDDNKQIDHIEPFEKMLSQKLVEECMIAANRCAARFLSEQGATGPYVTHPGFRGDRLDETRKFLEMHAPEAAAQDPKTVAGYRAIISALSAPGQKLPLRAMINRLLTRAELAVAPAPHMGMALEHYTNCTSPLRKYVDFLVHLQIKAALHGDEARLVDETLLQQLSDRISTVRAATLEAERWLAGKHLARMSSQRAGMSFSAKVIHVNSSGFNVRLDDNGLEGFVDLRKDPEKFSYDKWTASLTSTTRRFQLEQAVELRFTGVDKANRHQAGFELVEGCGLKPPREENKPAAG
ncbi:VacB/RNase II family 3'-5' exoribonuclease [Seongchinamella sediminis]|uniref:exoribonuclease II n=1 Tax=Seongchinamella sediminis TaxID=2283635 RepID=A0A3L7E0I9_9GAMM|nr:VacB/RNase II family 3'-5' exoribonuclease [Seongchinamella sediminis]RLQ22310.1 VacB/RNase II family 3'-5' exoribonuclease [Seongchinamella sediminis]